MVLASRAAGIEPPSDGVYIRIDDEEGLRREAEHARRLGFLGKSCIHPRQVPVVNSVFTPSPDEQEWARRVLAAFRASGGAAARTEDGEMVDEPVAARARRLLELAR
jgi:citrate lyase subunit beta/citryl-CoA lyase